MSNKAPLFNVDPRRWTQALRGITNATNERSVLSAGLPSSGAGNSAPIIDYETGGSVASALVMANMNSLPLDWAARLSVGGSNMNFFIVKQLPVLPPETYLEKPHPTLPTYVEMIIPRVIELVFAVTEELAPFAQDLGYDGPPFPWEEDRRHRLRTELDAIYAHMYHLNRADLEWILDAPAPSVSFPRLKQNELVKHGEYRTKRYVLEAYDQLARGLPPQV